jgi:hypothetical protein
MHTGGSAAGFRLVFKPGVFDPRKAPAFALFLLETEAGTEACTERPRQELMPSSLKILKYQVYILAPKSLTRRGFMVKKS